MSADAASPLCNGDRMVTTGSACSDSLQFLRAWAGDPLRVAAVAPSSRSLAWLMTSELGPSQGPVIELGPGTGVFTRAMIERGVDESDLTLVERGPEFASMLRRTVSQGKGAGDRRGQARPARPLPPGRGRRRRKRPAAAVDAAAQDHGDHLRRLRLRPSDRSASTSSPMGHAAPCRDLSSTGSD